MPQQLRHQHGRDGLAGDGQGNRSPRRRARRPPLVPGRVPCGGICHRVSRWSSPCPSSQTRPRPRPCYRASVNSAAAGIPLSMPCVPAGSRTISSHYRTDRSHLAGVLAPVTAVTRSPKREHPHRLLPEPSRNPRPGRRLLLPGRWRRSPARSPAGRHRADAVPRSRPAPVPRRPPPLLPPSAPGSPDQER